MSTRAQRYDAEVLSRVQVSPHLLRLTLSAPGLESTGIADEWVGLVPPGQFQVRYYTVRSLDGDRLVLDVVVHEEGLVTDWATGDCEGDRVVVTGAQGSFEPPADAAWLLLVGDLTAMPAMARIAETVHGRRWSSGVETRIWAEVPDDLAGYLPDGRRRDLAGAPGRGPVAAGRGRGGHRLARR